MKNAFGQTLRDARQRAGLTLDQVSRRTRYSVAHISEIETEPRSHRPRRAAQAAELEAQRSGRAQVQAHDLASTLRDLGEALRAAVGAARAEIVRAVVAPGTALLECYTRELELPIQIPTSGADQAEIALGGGADCSSPIPDFMRFRMVV
ncbi:MAG: helix-turn-helix domain-containing protein [Bosea sp. (in: a-proteobacteria)]